MKTKALFLSLTMLICIGGMFGCRKAGCMNVNGCNYDPSVKVDDGTCIDKGQVTFWKATGGNNYEIVVTINATETTITTPLVETPLCDASGCATFALCPGSHNYTAHEKFPGIATWTGNATSLENGCTTIFLQ